MRKTTRTIRPYEPDELWLLPPSPRDWLPEEHLTFFVSDLVEALDLTPILKIYGGVTRGPTPSHSGMLVKVLLYTYAVGISASRQIARELEEDVAFRVLAANQRPDFRTISDFRKRICRHWPNCLSRSCNSANEGHIALDGTKVKANASKHKAMSYGRMATEDERLQAEVGALLKQAEVADARDDATDGPDRRGDELTAELARREQRLQRIRAAKVVMEQEAQAEATLKRAAPDIEVSHRPRRGRPPQRPSSVPHPKAQRNFTDPESRIMPDAGATLHIHDDYFAPDAKDEDWLTEAGQHGWIVLTKAHRLRYRHVKRLALMKAGVAAFILTTGDLQGEEMAKIFVKALPRIKRFLQKHNKPFIAKMAKDGSVLMLFQ